MAAARALASLLRRAGYRETRIAHRGSASLLLAREFLPTLLFVELELPDMSGYELAKHLSQQPDLPGLRMIALTSSSQHPGRELAREAGFERYLIKPIAAAALDELMLLQ